MSLIQDYIREFNKLVSNTNFLSASNDIPIKNKLFLIQQDITEEVDFNSFECYSFFSNIYNILNTSSDPKSALVASCTDVLQKSINSRNKAIMKMVREINFLPAITKLLWLVNEDNFSDNLIKLLTLIKNLIMFSNELDEHNLKVFITSLRDLIENFNNEKVTKLSLHILSNLAMNNESAKYFIRRSIKTTNVQEKINKSSDFIALKFLYISYGEFLPKDFSHLIKLSISSIKDSIIKLDSESLLHAIDILKYSRPIINDTQYGLISEMDNIMSLMDDLNDRLLGEFTDKRSNELKREFLDNVFDYYSILLEFDNGLTHAFEKFTENFYENTEFTRSASGLKYLSNFITFGGSFSTLDQAIESIIFFFNKNLKNVEKNQIYAFLKFLKVLHNHEKLDNTHFQNALEFMEHILNIFEDKDFKIEKIDEDMIRLTVYALQTLYALSQDSSLFRDYLDKLLDLNFMPCILTKAYLLRNEEILQILFALTPMEKFPSDKIAKLLSKNNMWNQEQMSPYKGVVKVRETNSTSKFITGHLLSELENLINSINKKMDSDENVNTSDLILLYRQKNSYLQDHLTTVTESLNKYSDLYNEMQQQYLILSKLGEKQELINWSLQLEKEKYVKENQKLENANTSLGGSIASFRNKIDKEMANNSQIKKHIKVKDIEIEKLRSEKSAIESEKQKFRQAQKENEQRIQQLKENLEEEKSLRASEVNNALAEQKRVGQKAEKELVKFQEVIKLNEKDLIQKQQRITELETELKEAEKIQSSILSIMQKSKNSK